MNLIQLDKRSARKLELDSISIEDFFYIQPEIERTWEDIKEWYIHQGFGEFESQKNLIKRLSEIFRSKQNYNVKYEHRKAVWCFYWSFDQNNENNKFVLYQSVEGLQLKLHKDFNKESIVKFLQYLKSLLYKDTQFGNLAK